MDIVGKCDPYRTYLAPARQIPDLARSRLPQQFEVRQLCDTSIECADRFVTGFSGNLDDQALFLIPLTMVIDRGQSWERSQVKDKA